jgi:dUTP pyrophosphatase
LSTKDYDPFPKPEVNLEYFTGTLMSTALEEIEVVRVKENAILPSRKHEFDAGIDFYACIEHESMEFVEPGETKIFHTGVAIKIPKGFVGLLWPKSRSNFTLGAGVVDFGYQGEVLVKIINPTSSPILIEHGQAIAQLLIQPIETPKVKEVTKEEFLSETTERGNSGGIVSQYKVANLTSNITEIE